MVSSNASISVFNSFDDNYSILLYETMEPCKRTPQELIQPFDNQIPNHVTLYLEAAHANFLYERIVI